VKRVIAEEGDQVRIMDGRVRERRRWPTTSSPASIAATTIFGPTAIPDGYYFVMGDHA
jgi:hypothetical protein